MRLRSAPEAFPARASGALALLLLAPALAGCLRAGEPIEGAEVALPLAPGAFEIVERSLESFDGARIAFTVIKPREAGPGHRVPVVLHGHGWAEPRWSAPNPYLATLAEDTGLGIVSMSQRGHQGTAGPAHFLDPEYELKDVSALLDEIATWDWVALDAPGDPRVGTFGWSYGGAFQWLAALEETRLTGATRIDALAPQITWNDLSQALCPNGVPKTALLSALYAAALTGARGTRVEMAREHHEWVAEIGATGECPPAAVALFSRNSAAWYAAEGVRLDVPALLVQGATDTLFPLNHAFANWRDALTPEARAESALVAVRNGHPIPGYQDSSVLPDNPCTRSADWNARDVLAAWFRRHLARDAGVEVPAGVQLATREGECLRFDDVPAGATWRDVAPATPAGTPVPLAAGARLALPVAEGPLTLAGVPRVSANVSTLAPDARLFLALGIGASASDVRVAGDQWTPWRGSEGAIDALDLAGVVERVPAGQAVFLLVAPTQEQYAAHGSRAPGAVILEDLRVGLPEIA